MSKNKNQKNNNHPARNQSDNDFGFELKPAVRRKVPPLISLWSQSGKGKTYSALLLARGIVGPKGKIGVIDTENGRALFYDYLVGGWHHLDLQPPFTTDKYIAAFKFLERQGCDIAVVDSGSHVWEGEGGVLDQAEDIGGEGLYKWKTPKIRHKRYTNYLLRSAMPVIFCLRAKEGVKQVPDPDKPGKQKIVTVGWIPIAEKNFVFEMTLDLFLTGDGYYDLEKSKTIPEKLRHIIKPGGRITVEMGQEIAKYMGSAEANDAERINLKRDGQEAALLGVASYTEWAGKLTPEQKDKVREFHKGWTTDAKAADEAKAEAEAMAKAAAAKPTAEAKPTPGESASPAPTEDGGINFDF